MNPVLFIHTAIFYFTALVQYFLFYIALVVIPAAGKMAGKNSLLCGYFYGTRNTKYVSQVQ